MGRIAAAKSQVLIPRPPHRNSTTQGAGVRLPRPVQACVRLDIRSDLPADDNVVFSPVDERVLGRLCMASRALSQVVPRVNVVPHPQSHCQLNVAAIPSRGTDESGGRQLDPSMRPLRNPTPPVPTRHARRGTPMLLTAGEATLGQSGHVRSRSTLSHGPSVNTLTRLPGPSSGRQGELFESSS